MTDYVLKISSFGGLVAGARHWRGVIWGPHPESCHGPVTYNHPDARGKTTCEQRHVIPERVEWQIEDYITEEDMERRIASHFEDPGPAQMLTEADVVQVAVFRFLQPPEDRQWFEPRRPKLEPGDRLYLKWLPGQVEHDEWWEPGDMALIAEIPAEVPA